ncbi:hypothetical protein [Clostridium hydrogeniformans]|uniref:hypothetical protein n=1 Tax=Clostridium hydrogeniformans TaxID=349933 RepID=UPI00068DEEC8|nr:hypothetical protein [Clostridium hydrogeniformans]
MSDFKERENDKVMETVNNSGTAIQEIIMKAVQDGEFKKRLIEEPEEILNDYELSEVQKILIKSLGEDDYDKLTPENMEEFFAADSAVYTPDLEGNEEVEKATEDDI